MSLPKEIAISLLKQAGFNVELQSIQDNSDPAMKLAAMAYELGQKNPTCIHGIPFATDFHCAACARLAPITSIPYTPTIS